MSAYSDWKRGYLTDEEYRSSYAKEQWEQDHPYGDTPFYTDDPDDPHWRCENCSRYDECGCDGEFCEEFIEKA